MSARARVHALGAVVFACGAFSACTPRTLIAPLDETPPSQRYVAPSGCNVRDFASATDLPEGAKNLGWVSLEQQDGQSEDDAMIALRQKICELGGNALSQPAWVKGPSDEKPKLTANAWALP